MNNNPQQSDNNKEGEIEQIIDEVLINEYFR